MQLTKKEIIQRLYYIEEKQNLDLSKEVQKVIRNEIIPIEVIKVINKYDKTFLNIYDAYNAVYMARYRNPLYRNLKNPNIKVEELAIALSSLVTKILISLSKIEDEVERKVFVAAMDLHELNKAISNYAMFNQTEDLLECGRQVRELLEILYVD